MTLSQIVPTTRTSVLTAPKYPITLPSLLVGLLILSPGLIFRGPYIIVFSVLAFAAMMATEIRLAKLRHRRRSEASRRPPKALPAAPRFDVNARVQFWRDLLADQRFVSLVLFSFGTCVISGVASEQPTEDAKKLLDQFGHPVPGTRLGDMVIYPLPCGDYVVGGSHPCILTFVTKEYIKPGAPSDQRHTAAGYVGRDLRNLDAFAQETVQIFQPS